MHLSTSHTRFAYPLERTRLTLLALFDEVISSSSLQTSLSHANMVAISKILLFTTTVAAAVVQPRTSAYVAQAQSDIDTISDSIERVVNDLNNDNIAAVTDDLRRLNDDLQIATKDVLAGAPGRDLEAMAITFYVQQVMEPKVDDMATALRKSKSRITEAGKRKAVHRQLNALVKNTKELGRALVSKTPDERKPEARDVMHQIVRKLQGAADMFR